MKGPRQPLAQSSRCLDDQLTLSQAGAVKMAIASARATVQTSDRKVGQLPT